MATFVEIEMHEHGISDAIIWISSALEEGLHAIGIAILDCPIEI